jgi:radical SAM protein with 4Fe4S-binding SPASM domain
MVSNGRKFRDLEFCKGLKSAGLDYATFSVEGSSSGIHDLTTQISGSFDDTITGIERAIDCGIAVSTNTVISSINLYDLEDMVDKLSSIGIKNMSFNVSGVCLSKSDNEEFMINPQEAINRFEKVYVYAKNKLVKIRLVTPMPLCNFDQTLIDEFKREKVIGNSPCQMSHGKNFVLDYNGDVLPCTHLTGYPLFNTFFDDRVMNSTEFLDRYNSAESQRFRVKMSRYASSKCNNCNERCSGGCPLYWIKLNPDEQIKGQTREKVVS